MSPVRFHDSRLGKPQFRKVENEINCLKLLVPYSSPSLDLRLNVIQFEVPCRVTDRSITQTITRGNEAQGCRQREVRAANDKPNSAGMPATRYARVIEIIGTRAREALVRHCSQDAKTMRKVFGMDEMERDMPISFFAWKSG